MHIYVLRLFDVREWNDGFVRNQVYVCVYPSMPIQPLSPSLTALFLDQISERIAQLQEALLHCGKFQDALEPLLSWLSDTEELVANQKPPSAEYRVVKAQIQEQKVRGERDEWRKG